LVFVDGVAHCFNNVVGVTELLYQIALGVKHRRESPQTQHMYNLVMGRCDGFKHPRHAASVDKLLCEAPISAAELQRVEQVPAVKGFRRFETLNDRACAGV
jgi:hypothetical protein